MKLVRFQNGQTGSWGIKQDDRIHHLPSLSSEGQPWNKVTNSSYLADVEKRIQYGDFTTYAFDDVDVLPPVDQPSKIVNVGLNYEEHVTEQDGELPDKPLLFAKAPSAIIGHEDAIILPNNVEQVDYEVELALVIGRTARNLSPEEAHEYIAGYTVFNDISARDAQFEDGQFFRGKSYDTFAPIGPVLTVNEFTPSDAKLELHVNGIRKQQSTTRKFIFELEELLTFITSMMTLNPGDVVSTGTPADVGIFRDPPDLLKPGDSVEASIEGIGTLSNHTVSEIE
jgi:2-keto-4-pentenoate hydratase/2-oxohepta-3-ene-1,7-dioic acid hydratase in catechol pathway